MGNKIVVLVGASGSGKTTIGKELEELGVRSLLSFTTRELREGEYNMIDYRFINDIELGHQILLDNVIEMTKYNGNTYGLLREDVKSAMGNGSDVYFICDKNGASQIKEMYPEQCVTIFLKTDVKTMIDRMRRRGDDSESILSRVYNAVSNNELEFDTSIHDYCLMRNTKRRADPADDAGLILEIARGIYYGGTYCDNRKN